MRVYLSGPISGMPDGNRAAFVAAALDLRGRGLEVVNPVELADQVPPGATWGDYMRVDLRELLTCDELRVLPGWQGSRGP